MLIRPISSFLLVFWCFACQNNTNQKAPVKITADSTTSTQLQDRIEIEEPFRDFPVSKFAPAIKQLSPRSDAPVALLLGFDTDTSQNAQSYQRFFDDSKESIASDEDFPTNQTLLFTRRGAEVKLSGNMNCLASPQEDGFLFLGLVTYREKAKVEDEWYQDLQQKVQRDWPFEYTSIWQSRSYRNFGEAVHQQISRLKDTLDTRYAMDSLQFITDYEKPSYIVPGLLLTEGYYALIHGGASWFNAFEYNRQYELGTKGFSPRLVKYTSPERIRSATAEIKAEHGEKRPWTGTPIDYIYDPTFTLARVKGRVHLVGLLNLDANSSRTFLASFDAGPAPAELVGRNSFPLQYNDFKRIDPNLIDVFIGPNYSTIFVLTKEWVYGIDVATKRELYHQKHNLAFNKVVMVEWATNDHVERWEKILQNQ